MKKRAIRVLNARHGIALNWLALKFLENILIMTLGRSIKMRWSFRFHIIEKNSWI